MWHERKIIKEWYNLWRRFVIQWFIIHEIINHLNDISFYCFTILLLHTSLQTKRWIRSGVYEIATQYFLTSLSWPKWLISNTCDATIGLRTFELIMCSCLNPNYVFCIEISLQFHGRIWYTQSTLFFITRKKWVNYDASLVYVDGSEGWAFPI